MKLLYTNMLPLGVENGQETIVDHIHAMFARADAVDIAVGYISRSALLELDALVHQFNISHICLIIGMYFIEGMPESSYHASMEINAKWKSEGIGEIRLVKAFKYHGKAYLFSANDEPFDAVIGSANLGALKLEASNRRQYEFASCADDAESCQGLKMHIAQLAHQSCSACIDEIDNIPIVHEPNTALENIDLVKKIPDSDVQAYRREMTTLSFSLPIKVPANAERFMDDSKHFTKSNLNVCYAAPRSARKARDWYETQFTVAREFTLLPGYPEKNVPFFVVTDDGYWFKAHTTSDGNKQFSACGDELIMGRWIKGRLAAAGLVTPVNNTKLDTDRAGMITKEMLAAYGCNAVTLTKTTKRAYDGDELLDVWMLSFDTARS